MKKIIFSIVLITFITACSLTSSKYKRNISSHMELNSVDHGLENLIKKLSPNEEFSGNLLVYKDGQTIIDDSMGHASREHGVLNSSKTRFIISSMSKQFTAAAIYILEAKGKLSFNDSISKYIPLTKLHKNNRDAWAKIKIQDLLNHRSGLKKDLQNSGLYSLTERQNLIELTRKLYKDPYLVTNNYGTFNYSNIGFNFLARIVEIITSFKFDKFLSYYIFKPLEMKNSGVYHRSKLIKDMAEGYYYDEDGRLSKYCCQDSSIHLGSHNIYSTTNDLLIWMREISSLNSVIPKSFIAYKHSKESKVRTDTNYANGLYFEDQKERGLRVWHDGFNTGYASEISYYPKMDLIIVTLLNRVNLFTAQNVIKKITDEVVRRSMPRQLEVIME